MKKVVAAALFSSSFLVPMGSQAVDCPVPGTTITWATDQCLLETGETDPRSKTVIACLSKVNTIRQPCEWNTSYKHTYCKTLIAKRQFWGSAVQCMNDPAILGPTVRNLLESRSR